MPRRAYKAVVTEMGAASRVLTSWLSTSSVGRYYKQEHARRGARHQYMALLDHKVATGYDFEQTHRGVRRAARRRYVSRDQPELLEPSAEPASCAGVLRRPTAARAATRTRSTAHLGEFYLEKLPLSTTRRAAYGARSSSCIRSIGRPLRTSACAWSRSTRRAASRGSCSSRRRSSRPRYGLELRVLDRTSTVLRGARGRSSYLKGNLEDLASHYHARYQEPTRASARSGPATSGRRCAGTGAYLASFPDDVGHAGRPLPPRRSAARARGLRAAAREYERTAYDYPAHERVGRGRLRCHLSRTASRSRATKEAAPKSRSRPEARGGRAARSGSSTPSPSTSTPPSCSARPSTICTRCRSSSAPSPRARAADQEQYPEADPAIRPRGAWTTVAHSSLRHRRLRATPRTPTRPRARDDAGRRRVAPGQSVDNLAAAIYKQGEQASQAGDHRAAPPTTSCASARRRPPRTSARRGVRRRLRVDRARGLGRGGERTGGIPGDVTPSTSSSEEATKQIAPLSHRENGETRPRRKEYERVAAEADPADEELRRERCCSRRASCTRRPRSFERALAVYQRLHRAFPEPLELAVETRFKIAELHAAAGDRRSARPSSADRGAIDARRGRRAHGRASATSEARSALVLTEPAISPSSQRRSELVAALRRRACGGSSSRMGRGARGLRGSGRLRGRRGHGGRDLLHRRGLLGVQPLAARVRAPRDRPRTAEPSRTTRSSSRRRPTRSRSRRSRCTRRTSS